MEQIVGLYKDISQLIVGILVKETETHYVLRRALLCSVDKDKNGQGVVPNFFPVTLLTVDPPFHAMSFFKTPNIDFETWYKKEDLLNPEIQELNDQIVGVYRQNFVGSAPPSVPPQQSASPNDNVIKLF
jgi:hypothetical protein